MEPQPSRQEERSSRPQAAPAPAHLQAAPTPAHSAPASATAAGAARRIETLQPIEHPARFESQAGLKVRSRRRRVSLLRAIAADMGNNFFTYFLAVILCGLSIYKVVQVQETRDLIANLNEVTVHNENLNKDWLTLLAQRQALSEHNKIRREAAERLNMKAPRTEAEKVITLN